MKGTKETGDRDIWRQSIIFLSKTPEKPVNYTTHYTKVPKNYKKIVAFIVKMM